MKDTRAEPSPRRRARVTLDDMCLRAALMLAVVTLLGCAGAPSQRTPSQRAPSPAAPTVTTGDGPLAELAWLAGHWRAVDGERVTEEQWLTPRAGVMLGVSRTVQGGAVVHTEWLRIEAREGAVVYLADPSSQAPTEFTRAAQSESSAAFENHAHDYPQRIVYSRQGSRLTARIEDAAGERTASWEFEYVPAP